jgi:hypothetical protein
MQRPGLIRAIAVLVLALLVAPSGMVFGGSHEACRGRIRTWRPTLDASISAESITLGDSIEVVYSTKDATGAMRDWTQLRPFIGRSDGIVIPLNGRYSHTPTVPGVFETRLMATNRAANLNHNGKQEGWRRAVIFEFTVEVLAPGELPKYGGSIAVYRTTRAWWRSEGGAWDPRRQSKSVRHRVLAF